MTRTCKHCLAKIPAFSKSEAVFHKKKFCSFECMATWGAEEAERKKQTKKAKEEAEAARFREAISTPRKAKEYIRGRTEWLNMLQDLVNQYVLYVRDVDEPCCTCGTTSKIIKYDAGHCFTRGARPELRFELTNIHRQCSNDCNVHHSGRQAEHKQFIIEKYGKEHLEKLENRSIWPTLKETFPDNESIKEEILRYRALLREHGLKPRR